MECREVREWVLTSRPFVQNEGEGAPSACKEHLAGCTQCQQYQKADQRFDDAVHAMMQAMVVPADLESRIQWRLRQERRRQQRSRVLYWSMSAAALFFFVVSINWYYQRPYDLTRLHETITGMESRRAISTYDLSHGKQPSDLQQWLNRQGIAVSLPARLKLQHLTAAYIVEAGGRKVPVLELRAGSATSKICLLHRRYFDEHVQQQMRDQGLLSSYVITDHDQSESLGWMIVEQGSAYLFVEGLPPHNGV